MWYSDKYLQFFAASSHSSGPADLFNLAGPGTGTLTPLVGAMAKGTDSKVVRCRSARAVGSRGRLLRRSKGVYRRRRRIGIWTDQQSGGGEGGDSQSC